MNEDVKILVVDDDPVLLDLLIETLEAIGHSAKGVNGGEEALEYLQENKVELLITDIKMPGINGLELSQRINRLFPELPIIFISGALTPSIMQKIGTDPFLTKPFRINQIEQQIENALTIKAGKTDKSKHILVVDDDDGFRLMLMESLKLSGYTVYGAPDAINAIEKIKKGGIGSVITDIKMPGMDGISLARNIRQQWPDISIILVTAYFNFSDDSDMQFSSADGYFIKPFKIESITELLEDIKNKNQTAQKQI